MTTPELSPVRRYGGIAATWAFALLAAIAVSLVPLDARLPWIGIAGGMCTIVAFGAQLVDGRSHGFVFRVGVAVLGALGILGFIALVLALAAFTAGAL